MKAMHVYLCGLRLLESAGPPAGLWSPSSLAHGKSRQELEEEANVMSRGSGRRPMPHSGLRRWKLLRWRSGTPTDDAR